MDSSKNDQGNMNTETPSKAEKSKSTRFIGSFNHSLDTKGRLVIPQIFRDKLGETFCVAPSFDFKSVAIYPTEKWEERNETYEKLGKLNPALSWPGSCRRYCFARRICRCCAPAPRPGGA